MLVSSTTTAITSMPVKSKRPQHEIDAAVKKYLQGEPVESLAKQYKVSRAGMYLWIKKARTEATHEARVRDIGKAGVDRESQINKDVLIRQLKRENDELKQKLFKLMLDHKLI